MLHAQEGSVVTKGGPPWGGLACISCVQEQGFTLASPHVAALHHDTYTRSLPLSLSFTSLLTSLSHLSSLVLFSRPHSHPALLPGLPGSSPLAHPLFACASSDSLSKVMYGLAMVGHDDDQLYARMASRATQLIEEGQATPEFVQRMMWACGALSHFEPRFLKGECTSMRTGGGARGGLFDGWSHGGNTKYI